MLKCHYQQLGSSDSDAFETAADESGARRTYCPLTTSKTPKALSITLVIHIILLSINIFVLATIRSSTIGDKSIVCSDSTAMTGDVPFSPAAAAVKYSIDQIETYSMESSHFIGEPRLELDQAWSDLLRSTNIRISESEMRTMNKTSVALKDGSGYLGYLEVHHMLHCLKRFKQYRHLEHYPELDLQTFDLPHWDHCIEVIRRGVMCNADLMVDTLVWKSNGTWLQGVNHWPRRCATWESVQAFADSRAVQVDHYKPLESVLASDNERSIGPVDLL